MPTLPSASEARKPPRAESFDTFRPLQIPSSDPIRLIGEGKVLIDWSVYSPRFGDGSYTYRHKYKSVLERKEGGSVQIGIPSKYTRYSGNPNRVGKNFRGKLGRCLILPWVEDAELREDAEQGTLDYFSDGFLPRIATGYPDRRFVPEPDHKEKQDKLVADLLTRIIRLCAKWTYPIKGHQHIQKRVLDNGIKEMNKDGALLNLKYYDPSSAPDTKYEFPNERTSS